MTSIYPSMSKLGRECMMLLLFWWLLDTSHRRIWYARSPASKRLRNCHYRLIVVSNHVTIGLAERHTSPAQRHTKSSKHPTKNFPSQEGPAKNLHRSVFTKTSVSPPEFRTLQISHSRKLSACNHSFQLLKLNADLKISRINLSFTVRPHGIDRNQFGDRWGNYRPFYRHNRDSTTRKSSTPKKRDLENKTQSKCCEIQGRSWGYGSSSHDKESSTV